MTDSTTLPPYHVGETDIRPWGTWEVTAVGHENGEEFCIKTITVRPGGVLSLQSHELRREEWTVLSGTLEVTRHDEIIMLETGQSVDIPCGAVHRMANRGTLDAVVREIQRGTCREDDITRYQDIYGRK